MLASASTIAGNPTIFGAAGNIIITKTAEFRGMKVLPLSYSSQLGL
jgi:Na+/H+ antiporter NhaD/arsenite permease-like protein